MKVPPYKTMLIKVNWDDEIVKEKAKPVFYEEGELVPTNMQVEGDNLKITHTQKVDHILRANQVDRDNTDENWRHGETMKLGARIPLAVWLEWQKQGITEDPKALLRAIEFIHPEYKTTRKRLI